MSADKLTKVQLREFEGICVLAEQGRRLNPAFFWDARRTIRNLVSKHLIDWFEFGHEFSLTEEGKKLCRELGFGVR